jgi:hypothetical protein
MGVSLFWKKLFRSVLPLALFAVIMLSACSSGEIVGPGKAAALLDTEPAAGEAVANGDTLVLNFDGDPGLVVINGSVAIVENNQAYWIVRKMPEEGTAVLHVRWDGDSRDLNMRVRQEIALYDTSGASSTTPGPATTSSTTTLPEEVSHLAIVGVDVEPVPWVRVKADTGQMVCDFFYVNLTFHIQNKGNTDFPPAGVNGRSDRGGVLFYTVLYNGQESQDQYVLQAIKPYTFWNHHPLDVPAGGYTTLERQFRVPTDHPLNPFSITAWFTEPRSRLQSDIPPTGAPVIQQTYNRPDGTEAMLEMEQSPYVSKPFTINGPDLLPLQLIGVPDAEMARHYDTVLIFENQGTEARSSVTVSINVPDGKGSNSISWMRDINGPFAPGKYAVIIEDRLAMGEPDWTNCRARVSLHCTDAIEGFTSLGDVDLSNDVKLFKETTEGSSTSLSNYIKDVKVVLIEGED